VCVLECTADQKNGKIKACSAEELKKVYALWLSSTLFQLQEDDGKCFKAIKGATWNPRQERAKRGLREMHHRNREKTDDPGSVFSRLRAKTDAERRSDSLGDRKGGGSG